jgi:hypothetical protein
MKRHKHHAPRGPGWSPNFQGDRDALARLIEAEAGGEGDAGKLAVANVVRNRADSNYNGFGRGIEAQVRAENQFSAFNPHGSENESGKRTMAMPADGETMKHNYELADRVLGRMEPDPTGGANQYYAPQGMPGHKAPKWWNENYKTAEIGHQRFQQNPAQPVTPDQGQMRMGDAQMLAGMPGNTQTAQSPMATMMAQAVHPAALKPSAPPMQLAEPSPPQALSNQRYSALNQVAPRGGDNEFRDMARHSASVGAPNRMAMMENPVAPPMQHADAPVLHEPGVQQAQMSPMEGMSIDPTSSMAGGPMMSPMSAQMPGMDGGLGGLFSNAVMPPEMMTGDMGGGFGGMDFGGFDLGGLFG